MFLSRKRWCLAAFLGSIRLCPLSALLWVQWVLPPSAPRLTEMPREVEMQPHHFLGHFSSFFYFENRKNINIYFSWFFLYNFINLYSVPYLILLVDFNPWALPLPLTTCVAWGYAPTAAAGPSKRRWQYQQGSKLETTNQTSARSSVKPTQPLFGLADSKSVVKLGLSKVLSRFKSEILCTSLVFQVCNDAGQRHKRAQRQKEKTLAESPRLKLLADYCYLW